MGLAFVFPGQGSESIGMLAELAQSDPLVGECFAEASQTLGYDLWELVREGPQERLNSTEYTQPAMLVAGIAVWRVWCSRGGVTPTAVSGHSLGEFTALVAAQALDFATAVDLVRFRGQLMQNAMPRGTGAMAAILGLDDAQVEAACREAADEQIVEAVNFNAPGQVVIAGHSAAVARAIEIAKASGAKRAVMLTVSVPSHSSLMRKAADQLGERLAATRLDAPRIAYWSAVDAAMHSEPQDIRRTLVRQLASPVRWADTVRRLAAQGSTQLVECGPGKVLTGLNRRIERQPGTSCHAIEDPAALDAAIAATGGVQTGK